MLHEFRKYWINKYLVILLIVLPSVKGLSQEFVVIDDTIVYDMSSIHGYTFYLPGYISTLPQNWASPYNYKSGQFHTYYEIISQVSDEPCGLQFGIWQSRISPPVGEKDYSETMADIVELNGPGSIVMNNSSPTGWWHSYEGVDFARVSGFLKLGINIWALPPTRSVIAPKSWGGDSLYIDEVWNKRDEKWFPIKIKVVVVAVASGHTFSGWENYVVMPVKPPKPGYHIDYQNETTNEAVPSTDEYSVNSNMSGAISGTGIVIDVTPGQNLYFRTKAEGINPASDIQTLTVLDRPDIPDFEIDYMNERTSEVVTSSVDYSINSDMSSAYTGNNDYITVTPGTDMYFQIGATSSGFSSEIQHLIVDTRPPTPQFSINYDEETTTEIIPATVSVSENSDMSEAIAGEDDYLSLEAGTTYYFQQSAISTDFASEIQTLKAPLKPVLSSSQPVNITEAPITVSIDFTESVTGFTVDDIDVINGTALNLRESYIIDINPTSQDSVFVQIPVNVISEGNFKSNKLSFKYDGNVTGTVNNKSVQGNIDVYPNPTHGIVTINIRNEGSVTVQLISMLGQVEFEKKIQNWEDNETIDFSNYKKGYYILRINTGSNSYNCQLLLK